MVTNDRINLFGTFALDLARGCVLEGARPIHLRRQAYEVLRYLVENRGHLISKDQLIEQIWEGRAVTDGSLGKCIEEVREALGPEARQYLRNVRGRGYIFDTGAFGADEPVSTHEQIEIVRLVVEDEKTEESEATRPESSRIPASLDSINAKRPWPKALLAAAGVVVFSLAGFGGYRLLTKQPGNLAPLTSIAVLPFVNESANPDLEYLSDGVSESLINNLSQVPKLKVIARSSAFEYKRKEVDVKEVSRALNVNGVLTGRVAQRGDELLVSVELIDARDRTQIWGERYERKVADLEDLEKEITRTISDKLRLRLSGDQTQQLTKRATQNPEAYELYLNGMFYFRKPGLEGIKKSLDYYNRAVAIDPNFAPAWLEVGRVNSYFAGNSLADPKESLAKAKAALQRALELDGTLADAHSELARLRQSEWSWADAENEYRRAIELNSNLAEAHQMYSGFLSIMGRHEEALAEIRLAQELDPLRIGLRRKEAYALSLARRYDEAVEKAERAMTLESSSEGNIYYGLGLIYEASGRYQQAIVAYRKAMSILGETTSLQCYLGYTLAVSGKRKEALAILQNLKTTKDYVSPTELATLYVGLGDKETAMTMLERAYSQHDLQLGFLKIDQHFDSLRTDPRFQDLMRRVGLPS